MARLRETRDPAVLNHFAQHPDIASEIGGPLDLTDALRETAVFLVGDHGLFCFEWCAPETYEIHVLLTKDGRGVWGFEAIHEALSAMSDRASHIWARVKARHIVFYARKAGFREVGEMTLCPGPERWRIYDWRR